MHKPSLFLKCHPRVKDGKEHRYWSLCENRRTQEGQRFQRQIIYLGEINDSQKASWLWKTLKLDEFWSERLAPSREGTQWRLILKALSVYRLIAPGSEWRLHRQWFDSSALSDLLGPDFQLGCQDNPYRTLDRLLKHKQDLFTYLRSQREGFV